MSAVLAAQALRDAAPRTYWLDDPDAPAPLPPLTGVTSTDLAVVGGGYTGLWTALRAVERDPGRRVVVLESGRCGFEASGRNGGFCSASITHGFFNGLARWPDEIDELERLGAANLDGILAAIDRYLPDLAHAMAPFRADAAAVLDVEAVEDAFAASPKISIDYGVMERADNVWVVPGDFGWSDVGDWRAVHELADKDDAGNRGEGNVLFQDTHHSYARSADGRLLVLVGMRDALVVDTGDAVLVCHRDRAQQVKDVVDFLGLHGMTDYV